MLLGEYNISEFKIHDEWKNDNIIYLLSSTDKRIIPYFRDIPKKKTSLCDFHFFF